MRLPTLVSVLLAATVNLASASDAARTASIYIQPITSPSTPPSLLAELAIPDQPSSTDPEDSTTAAAAVVAEVLSYSAPELPEADQTNLVRIGLYEHGSWISSTSVASTENFAKGYAPHFVVSLDGEGNYLGVTCRGVAVDAGVTRDFGPQAFVVRTEQGAQPALGKPVVLSPEGRKVTEEGEKSFIQKYWWALAIGAFLLLSGGGGDEK